MNAWRRSARLVSVLLALCAGAARAGAPDWVERAAAPPTPAWARDARAVVLLDSMVVEAPASGRVRERRFGARRVLDVRGADPVAHAEVFDREHAAVPVLRGWVISPNGRVRALGDAAVAEGAWRNSGSLYSGMRARVLSAGHLEPGDVLAWECVTERDPFLAQWWFAFGHPEWPVVRAAFRVVPPANGTPVAHWRATPAASASRDGAAWTWTASDLRPPARERLASAWAASPPLLAVALEGTAGRTFAAWPAVGAYLDSLAAPVAEPGPAVHAAAAAALAGARTTLDSLRALARAAQAPQYVAIDLDLWRGGGYRPHPPADVLANGFGDCKDKANLFRALARAAGFEAWLLSAYAGDPDAVDPGWPSPGAFNHKIAAVRVHAGTAPAEFTAADGTHLVAFDPTDPVTPFGHLPMAEQGSRALLERPRGGELVTLPVAAPEARDARVAFTGAIGDDGVLAGTLDVALAGAPAIEFEALRRASAPADLAERTGRWFAVPGVAMRADSVRVTPLDADGRLTLRAALRGTGPVLRGGAVALLRPLVASAFALPELPDSARHAPVAVPLLAEEVTAEVKLPAGWAPESLPASRAATASFGTLESACGFADGTLRARVAIATRREVVAPERYAEVRAWCEAARAAYAGAIVLARR